MVTDRAVYINRPNVENMVLLFKGCALGIVALAHENESDVWVEDASIASINCN